jgi:hypothetical protein
MQATNADRAKAAYGHWQATYTPSVPAPKDSSAVYAEGWKYGDWWVSQGRSKSDTSETPDNWSEDRANGFWDRLNCQA